MPLIMHVRARTLRWVFAVAAVCSFLSALRLWPAEPTKGARHDWQPERRHSTEMPPPKSGAMALVGWKARRLLDYILQITREACADAVIYIHKICRICTHMIAKKSSTNHKSKWLEELSLCRACVRVWAMCASPTSRAGRFSLSRHTQTERNGNFLCSI